MNICYQEQPGSLVKRDVLNQGGRLYAIPKEIWRLVDHLWQYGCDQVSCHTSLYIATASMADNVS